MERIARRQSVTEEYVPSGTRGGRILVSIIALALLTLGTSCLEPLVEVTVLVRVNPDYPTEYDGLYAADPVESVEVELKNHWGLIFATGLTGPDGTVRLEVPGSGYYTIDIKAATSSPTCWWLGRESIHVYTEPVKVTVDVWTDGVGCPGPLVETSVLVRVDPDFPYEDFGLLAGDPVPHAQVIITDLTTDERVALGWANELGVFTVEIPGIAQYRISAWADTIYPICVWDGSTEIITVTEPVHITIDAWAACQ